MTTLEIISQKVAAEHEEYPIADAIAAYCATKVGKSVSKRDIQALEAAHPKFRFTLHKETGFMSHTSVTGWVDGKWNDTRLELRIAREGTYAKWPTVEELKTDTNNARYFHYKDKRNAERVEALDPNGEKALGLKKVADLTDAFILLHQELKAALDEYNFDEASVSYKVRELIKEKTSEEVKFY